MCLCCVFLDREGLRKGVPVMVGERREDLSQVQHELESLGARETVTEGWRGGREWGNKRLVHTEGYTYAHTYRKIERGSCCLQVSGVSLAVSLLLSLKVIGREVRVGTEDPKNGIYVSQFATVCVGAHIFPNHALRFLGIITAKEAILEHKNDYTASEYNTERQSPQGLRTV